ncbi:hypothetical protein AGLY_006960 [Aphis glycines]|uniref:Uncharacterized protein n=1 Tax=Aphis glycines TaxID=307491 RepID=A0A6G0TPP7_APHGL|nr:hypothetical protein AGLY_006960 [Aphis glycines]
MTYVGDGEKRTQKKEKGLDLFSKKTANYRSDTYIAAKSSLFLIQKLAKLSFENQKLIVFLISNIKVKKKLKYYTAVEKHNMKNGSRILFFVGMKYTHLLFMMNIKYSKYSDNITVQVVYVITQPQQSAIAVLRFRRKEGENIKIKILDVDRARCDLLCILRVLLSNNLHEIGTKLGRLYQPYSWNQFTICKKVFIQANEVPPVQISLREVAKMCVANIVFQMVTPPRGHFSFLNGGRLKGGERVGEVVSFQVWNKKVQFLNSKNTNLSTLILKFLQIVMSNL